MTVGRTVGRVTITVVAEVVVVAALSADSREVGPFVAASTALSDRGLASRSGDRLIGGHGLCR